MIPERADVPEEYVWHLEAMYASEDLWEKEFQEVREKSGWGSLGKNKGKLSDSAATLKETITLFFDIDRVLEKLYTYAHMRFDENLGRESSKNAYVRIQSLYHDFQMETSWIEPELLKISEENFQELIEDPELQKFRNYLLKISRMRAHTLSEREEELLALSGKALETAHKSFSAFNNADLKFKKAVDQEGKEHELSQGLYMNYLQSSDRTLRKSAFENIHMGYAEYENTLCELLNGQVQNHIYQAKARKFSSALDAALYPYNVDVSVVKNLIQSVRKNLGVLHKYVSLRKKLLGVDELYNSDLYVPLVQEGTFHMEYAAARDVVVEAMAPLGEEYQKTLRKGLFEERWVDVYEAEGKRSGGYSSGCYDSHPYILLNYTGTLNDVFTLAHEAGHSMHSYLSDASQNFVDAQYPIFVAEVASTFNEQLLLRKLLEKAKDDKEKAYLINYAIDGMRGTLFRQTLFAEFELKIHEAAEKGIPITPAFLRKEYRALNEDYYGPDLVIDPLVEIEWARIPHFYYNFYVYQYATGISAALALVKGALASSEKKENYLKFLSSGGSEFPLKLLQIAGVDMTSPEPVESAISLFGELVKKLEVLLGDEMALKE